jgi:hypothetical protein
MDRPLPHPERDGVDDTLIEWMLSLTPDQRLEILDNLPAGYRRDSAGKCRRVELRACSADVSIVKPFRDDHVHPLVNTVT